MNFQDAARAYFRKALGVSSGSYVELATRYWKGKLDGTIGEGSSEISSNSISDATAVGKSVLTATTAAAARTAIGAGTSNFSGSYGDLTNKPTIPAAATVDNLGGAGTTGKVVMKAANAEAARTAIGAADAATVADLVSRVQALEAAGG